MAFFKLMGVLFGFIKFNWVQMKIIRLKSRLYIFRQENEKLNNIRNYTLASLKQIMSHESYSEPTRLRASQ